MLCQLSYRGHVIFNLDICHRLKQDRAHQCTLKKRWFFRLSIGLKMFFAPRAAFIIKDAAAALRAAALRRAGEPEKCFQKIRQKNPIERCLHHPQCIKHFGMGLWRNGSASDSRSEGWEFESLWPHFFCSMLDLSLWITCIDKTLHSFSLTYL